MDYTRDKRFLQHLENCIPESAYNYRLSSYTIILEAWRRGLSVDFQVNRDEKGTLTPNFYIGNKDKKHRFNISTGDTVSAKAKRIVKDKHITKEYLSKSGVNTPSGEFFDSDTSDEVILKYSNKVGYPLAIKPPVGFAGKGVIANIKNEEEMINAVKYVREQLNYKTLIVERHFHGEDHRFYVVGDEVIGVIKRDPASITGNSTDTIETLLEMKNEDRKKILSITNKPIKVNSETKELLRQSGYTMKSVPKKDEVVFLKSKSNISAGGEAVDVTDDISEEMKQLAVDAAKSIPTLVQAGVDIMIDKENNTGIVLEINSRASIRSHVYPSHGKARDIPKAIIDHYFPETKNYNRNEAQQIYIDYDYLFSSNLSRSVASIKLPKFPSHPIILKRYIISGCEYTEKLAKRVQRLAFDNKVNGYIKPMSNSDIVIIVGGNDKKINTFYEQINKYVRKISKHSKITVKARTTPVAHGFNIVDMDVDQVNQEKISKVTLDKYSNLESKYQNLVERLAEYEQKESVMEITEKQNKQLKKRLGHIEKSTSWKVTKPIRVLGKINKK